MCICTGIYIHTWVWVGVRMYARKCVCMCVYSRVHVHVCVCVYARVCMCAYVYMCMHIYTFVCIYWACVFELACVRVRVVSQYININGLCVGCMWCDSENSMAAAKEYTHLNTPYTHNIQIHHTHTLYIPVYMQCMNYANIHIHIVVTGILTYIPAYTHSEYAHIHIHIRVTTAHILTCMSMVSTDISCDVKFSDWNTSWSVNSWPSLTKTTLYIYINRFKCMYTHVYTHVHMYTYRYIYRYIGARTYTYIHVLLHTQTPH